MDEILEEKVQFRGADIFWNFRMESLLYTMGISVSEKRINKGGWNSKIREKVSNLDLFLREKSLNKWKNDKYDIER